MPVCACLSTKLGVVQGDLGRFVNACSSEVGLQRWVGNPKLPLYPLGNSYVVGARYLAGNHCQLSLPFLFTVFAPWISPSKSAVGPGQVQATKCNNITELGVLASWLQLPKPPASPTPRLPKCCRILGKTLLRRPQVKRFATLSGLRFVVQTWTALGSSSTSRDSMLGAFLPARLPVVASFASVS